LGDRNAARAFNFRTGFSFSNFRCPSIGADVLGDLEEALAEVDE
jgi:hypothetical protein